VQVLVTLEQLERVSTFQEFVQIFSQFGNEMVEFAHLTGDRQNVSAHTHTLDSPSIILSLHFTAGVDWDQKLSLDFLSHSSSPRLINVQNSF